MVSPPWLEVPAIDPAAFAQVRRRLMFESCKWDPQCQDVDVLCPLPLVLHRATWDALAADAEALYAEAVAAEAEILTRTELLAALGLPEAIRRALSRAGPAPAETPRVMRFDFHPTREGWSLSEVNADVPGGYIEASSFPELMAPLVGNATVAGNPASAVTDLLQRAIPRGGSVGLVHATAYADDAQVMHFLARRLAQAGFEVVLLAPQHVRLDGSGARVDTEWRRGALDAVIRFFPAEWLPQLPRASWRPYLANGPALHVNPATSLVLQSKRFPLVWDALRTPLLAWRRLLPETVDPRRVHVEDGTWILKSALGRVGDGVAVPGVTSPRDWRRMRWAARLRPGAWVAQQRFESLGLETAEGTLHLCVGVFVVDGRAAGAYARAARKALIDGSAMDVPVLVRDAA